MEDKIENKKSQQNFVLPLYIVKINDILIIITFF